MGQRAFRGRIADSLIKNYLTSNSENSSSQNNADFSTSTTTHEDILESKMIDLNLEYNIDFPLNDIQDLNSVLSRGIVNSMIPKGKQIKNLNLVIISSLFGTGKTPLHCNFYLLFGSYFTKDIRNIKIKLYNPVTKKFYNDRKTISNILDFMCFKTIKLVNINKSLLYYVIPEYSDFAIVLAYKDINLYESHFDTQFENLLEDLLFHPYCQFERRVENFMSCLGAIEKTVPGEVNNIILPIVFFNDLDLNVCRISNIKKRMCFRDLHQFLIDISNRFKIMSLELKIKFSEVLNDNNKKSFSSSMSENLSDHFSEDDVFNQNNKKNNDVHNLDVIGTNQNFLKFVNIVINENEHLLETFTYAYISFDFVKNVKSLKSDKILDNNIDTLNIFENPFNPPCDIEILKEFKNILIKKKLYNLTIANHITFSLKNLETNLDDKFNFYDYIHYDKSYADKIWIFILLLKNSKNKILSVLYKKKIIMKEILQSLFDFNKIFKIGRIDYSTEMVKNKKIVPFEVSHNNMMMFTN